MTAAASVALTAGVVPKAFAASGPDTQWWRWRGPQGTNQAATGTSAPANIDRAKAVWSVNVPGRGHSSPIVVGDSIYLTTADKRAGTQSVLAVSRDGKAKWIQTVHQGGIPAENHPKNTEASSTLAFDGEALFGSFYNAGAIHLTKLDTSGRVLWQKSVGAYQPKQYKYGYAASPLLYGNTVIVVGDFDGPGFLAALDRQTGETVWKVRRPGRLSFSSPIVATIAGREQLLLSGADMVASYDPKTGDLIWKVDDATTMATCGTMVWDGDRVFASGGYPKPETVCIAADGSGKVLWSNNTKCYEQSMLAYRGYIYAVADSAIAFCWRASDGKTMWRQRLGGKYSSSPLLVGETIYVYNETGDGFTFAANPGGFEGKVQKRIADEVFASPVVVDDTLYLRVADNRGQRQESLLAFR
ncbi:MAG: PQQ-binding-like beta-propeller repeat protein [Planctomycetota bacterium]